MIRAMTIASDIGLALIAVVTLVLACLLLVAGVSWIGDRLRHGGRREGGEG